MTTDRVFIAEWVADELKAMAEAARPLETGGVLVGVLRDGEPWITNAVQVVDERSTRASFEIPKGVTPIAVDYLNLGPNAGTISRGIMDFVGDEVRFFMAHPGSPRPTDFDASAGAGTLSQWRRKT